MKAPSIHIRRKSGIFDIDWSEIWRYRDLLGLLVYRDFASRYKQTILGPLWFVFQPLLSTIVFTVIFGKIAEIPTDGIPPMLFYLTGMLGWNYFHTTASGNANIFQQNAGLFGKVYFPRVIVPVASSISQLIGWCIQFATFLAIYAYFLIAAGPDSLIRPHWTIILFPLLLLQSALVALGVGFWFSALSAKYRDLQNLTPFLLQIWLYVTPVVFPLSKFPEQWRWIVVLNPVTMIVENIKFAFLGAGTTNLFYTAMSIAIALVVFLTGLVLFEKVERNFVDSV